MFEGVCCELGAVLGGEATNLMRFEPDGTQTFLAGWNPPGVALALPVGMWIPLEGETALPRMMRTGRPERIDDYAGFSGALVEMIRGGRDRVGGHGADHRRRPALGGARGRQRRAVRISAPHRAADRELRRARRRRARQHRRPRAAPTPPRRAGGAATGGRARCPRSRPDGGLRAGLRGGRGTARGSDREPDPLRGRGQGQGGRRLGAAGPGGPARRHRFPARRRHRGRQGEPQRPPRARRRLHRASRRPPGPAPRGGDRVGRRRAGDCRRQALGGGGRGQRATGGVPAARGASARRIRGARRRRGGERRRPRAVARASRRAGGAAARRHARRPRARPGGGLRAGLRGGGNRARHRRHEPDPIRERRDADRPRRLECARGPGLSGRRRHPADGGRSGRRR